MAAAIGSQGRSEGQWYEEVQAGALEIVACLPELEKGVMPDITLLMERQGSVSRLREWMQIHPGDPNWSDAQGICNLYDMHKGELEVALTGQIIAGNQDVIAGVKSAIGSSLFSEQGSQILQAALENEGSYVLGGLNTALSQHIQAVVREATFPEKGSEAHEEWSSELRTWGAGLATEIIPGMYIGGGKHLIKTLFNTRCPNPQGINFIIDLTSDSGLSSSQKITVVKCQDEQGFGLVDQARVANERVLIYDSREDNASVRFMLSYVTKACQVDVGVAFAYMCTKRFYALPGLELPKASIRCPQVFCFEEPIASYHCLSVVGGGDALGNWDKKAAVRLTMRSGRWTLRTDTQLPAGTEFKFLINGEWEERTSNRRIGDSASMTKIPKTCKPRFMY